jgi:hypothetical protein
VVIGGMTNFAMMVTITLDVTMMVATVVATMLTRLSALNVFVVIPWAKIA